MSRISTAMLLAAAAVGEARNQGDPTLQRNAALARTCLLGSGRGGMRLLQAVDHAPGRGLLRLLEWLCLPGLGAHYAWRKRYLRRWALQACRDGVEQVLILGAGFDGLSLTLLAQVPALRVFEIERAHIVSIKRAALQVLGYDDPRLVLAAGELGTRPLGAVLGALPAFDPRRQTLVIAEGVLMYLPLTDVQQLLWRLACVLPDARLIATAMAQSGKGAVGFRHQRPWVRHWLRRAGEPFRWGAARHALPALLGTAGVQLSQLADPDGGDDPDPAPGEWLFTGRLAAAPSPTPLAHARLRGVALP
jgi:methyltransferase (TIGR00027 family)